MTSQYLIPRLVMSKPCINCTKRLQSSYIFKSIYYTNEDGIFIKM